jgi:predicted AAA+ superfamily ATPase
MNWLEVYQVTHVIRMLRPFAAGGRREIIAQPKIYGFDTGFVCHARGWDQLRNEDCGVLWEHLVLESLAASATPRICYWRDKQQREIDFIIPRGRDAADAVECKWQADEFTPRNLQAFREGCPRGRNFVVTPGGTQTPYERTAGGMRVKFLSLERLRHLVNEE